MFRSYIVKVFYKPDDYTNSKLDYLSVDKIFAGMK